MPDSSDQGPDPRVERTGDAALPETVLLEPPKPANDRAVPPWLSRAHRARRGMGRVAVRRLLGPRAAPHPAHHGARRLLPVAGDGARGGSSGATRLAARERHRARARDRAGVLGGVPRRRRFDRRRAGRRPDRPRPALRARLRAVRQRRPRHRVRRRLHRARPQTRATAGSAATTARSCRTPPRWRWPSGAVSSTSSPC